MDDLTSCTAVTTGGTDGMGAATARLLRARGADVVILGRSRAKADAMLAADRTIERPGELHAIVTDLGLMRSARAAASEVLEIFPHIDFLLNAAGIPRHRRPRHARRDDQLRCSPNVSPRPGSPPSNSAG